MTPISQLGRSAILFTLSLSCAVAAANDSPLEGCWRTQQIRMTLADGSHRDQNGDCVTEYNGTRVRSRCQTETGATETLSRYERIGPDRLRVTSLDIATETPNGASTEVRYRIEDEWLLTDLNLKAAGATSNERARPVGLRAVLIRVHVGNSRGSRCEPRGKSNLRVGRTPSSSLVMNVPSGWEPLLVDSASNNSLSQAVDSSFLIGEFVPRKDMTTTSSHPDQLVLILDDARYGPSPIRQGEFISVKKRFAGELGVAKLTCDEADRVCASLQLPDGRQVYTELFNVQGRVVMVNSTGRSQSIATDILRKSVRIFEEQLRADNTD